MHALSCLSVDGLADEPALLGVITRGFTVDDGEGPTYTTRITELLNRPVNLTWPPGLHRKRATLVEINERYLDLEGRDQLLNIDGQFGYRIWIHREAECE